jgi:hypothetical protein
MREFILRASLVLGQTGCERNVQAELGRGFILVKLALPLCLRERREDASNGPPLGDA